MLENSPADKAGLKNGQRLVAVNGFYVNKETDKVKGILEKISEAYSKGNYVKVLLFDSENWFKLKNNSNMNNRNSMGPGEAYYIVESRITMSSSKLRFFPIDEPIPTLCRIPFLEENMNFSVSGLNNKGSDFKINYASSNSLVFNSGLQNDDYLSEICGENIKNMDYEELIKFIMLKKNEDDLQMLVANRVTIEWYKARTIPIFSRYLPKIKYIELLYNQEILASTNYNGILFIVINKMLF